MRANLDFGDQASGGRGMSGNDNLMDDAQDALNRLARALNRGTGCRLTRDHVAGLGITFLGQTIVEPDPRAAQKEGE